MRKTLLWAVFCFSLVAASTIGCANGRSKQETPVITKQDPTPTDVPGYEVSFAPLTGQPLAQEEPKQTYKKISSEKIGDVNGNEVTAMFYVDESNKEPQTKGSIYAYIRYKDVSFSLGDVSYSYGFNEVRTNKINTKLKSSPLKIIGSIGTAFTETKLIGYDECNNRFTSWDVLGEPQFVDFEGEPETLILSFEGVHLNPANVYLLRWSNDRLEQAEQADAAKTFQNPYARLIKQDKKALIESSPNDVSQFYTYRNGKLIRAAAPAP